MVGLHVSCIRIRNKNFWTCNSISNRRQKRIMPTNGFWEDRTVPISQRLRYFDAVVSSVACFAGGHRTIYKEHIQTLDLHFVNSADPSWGPRRTLTGHLNGMRFCTLGTSVQHILLASQRYRVGPEFAVVRIGKLAAHIAKLPIHHWIQRVLHWHLWGPRRIGRPKHRWDSKPGDVLSLPKIGSLGGHCAGFCSVEATIECVS